MGKTVSIFNQKGGVGKTTTCVNFAAALGLKGKKTLLVDLDPQGNTTSGVGIDKTEIEKSTYDILINDEAAKDIVIKTEFKNTFRNGSLFHNLNGSDFIFKQKALKNSIYIEV